MTDLVTGNQIDIAAFDAGMSNNDKRKQLRGTRFADWVEDRGRDAVGYLQRASQDQEGWHDDALRLAGGGLKNVGWLAERPGIKQGLQVLGAGGWAGGKLGEAAAQRLGIDPRLGQWTGGFAGDAVTGGLLKKGAQIAKTTRQLGKLSPLESGRLVTGGGFGAAPVGPRTKLGKLQAAATMRGSTRKAIDQAVNDIPNFGNKAKFTKFSKKIGGSPEAIEQGKQAIQEATEYFNKHGNLRGRPQGNYWTHPETGKKFLIKNKTARGAAPNINMDDVEGITKTRMQREAGAKLNTKEIDKIGSDLGWDDKKIADYKKYANNEKKTLKALIRDLNKKDGKTTWSLGHRDAVKHQIKGNADRPKNIELEPLANFYDSKGRLVKGNAARAANDELSQVLSRMTDTTQDIYEDMLHWSDNDLGSFWPKMGPVTDVESFIRESEKRQRFIKEVQRVAKQEGISELEAGHDVLQRLKIMNDPLGTGAKFPSIRSYSKK